MTKTQHIVSSLLMAAFTAAFLAAGHSIAADAVKSGKGPCVTQHDHKNMPQEEFDHIYNSG